jgi:hypothetical protein
LALEPDFAPALAQAAGCHSQLYFNRWTEDLDFHRTEGLRKAELAVRAGADDAALASALRVQVWGKVAGHEAHLDQGWQRFEGVMTRIGG